MKKAKYNKHLSFEDRVVIEEFLNNGYSFTKIGNRISKNRTTIARDVLKHRFLRTTAHCNNDTGCFETKPPYVCNGCKKLNYCKKIRYTYSHSIAFNEYKKNLIQQRSHLKITKEEISAINDIVAPLMIHKHHSVNHVFITHPKVLPFSKPTFYRYIDLGIINIKNIDLARKVKYKIKKEYDYTREKTNTKIKIGRFYTDFQDYLEYNPNCSWQKGAIEKNHEYIRYILPKGTSFSGLSQEDCYLIASHINSTPRLSLNNQSPYEAAFYFIGDNNINNFQIKKINTDNVDLTIRLLNR